ncbi:MAG: hypothetical protein UT55_C0060G0002 [Candidatus Peregrinibacteria bacterium GW2011_GWE2_39_6]|nr:MAG: hypothetical protein UT36_C0002G0090 [Candidatus Peregrinibacteria bacterium GW2011_GWF2_39_17]KKR24540.1 MAG: hypothetical protein UT55_C0060G0002 [Candidatus Peregrinibacteria bacterium GW2011_GWE2_39_6]HCW32195.1 hypothetical protein [Candidatus Peregrinibacteria bacterium]
MTRLDQPRYKTFDLIQFSPSKNPGVASDVLQNQAWTAFREWVREGNNPGSVPFCEMPVNLQEILGDSGQLALLIAQFRQALVCGRISFPQTNSEAGRDTPWGKTVDEIMAYLRKQLLELWSSQSGARNRSGEM